MNRLMLIVATAVMFSASMAPARADTLLVDRAHMNMSMERSMHGMSMAMVEQRMGPPSQKLEPRGGQKPQWPVINRWVYPQCTVYFAHGRVVDVVLNHASPEEIGPAPVH